MEFRGMQEERNKTHKTMSKIKQMSIVSPSTSVMTFKWNTFYSQRTQSLNLSFFIFYQIFSLFTFQMLSSFLVSPLKIPYPFPSFPCSPTHLLLLPGPGIPLYWGIEPSQDLGPLLPLMTDQAILCYIYSQSHKFYHVFSLVVQFQGALGVLVSSY